VNTLAEFIRVRKASILDEWLADVRHLPSAHVQPTEKICDHIPDFIDRLADAVEREDVGAVTMRGLPNLHAAVRVREGYDLRQVVAEYRSIRTVICRLYREQGDISEESRPKLKPINTMNAVLDTAIADAVDQYSVDQGKAREMFIGMLGHDLREPLGTIAFSANVLLERLDGLDARTRKSAARIAASAKRMESMIRDLLDFARGRLDGGFPIVPVPLEVRALVTETVDEIRHSNPDREIVCLARDASGAFDAQWDPDRVAQVMMNLLGNAIAHGRDPIVVRVEDRSEWLAIEVANMGEIPAAALPHLFLPFSPPDAERRHGSTPQEPERRRGHLGLGLYIVSEIATAHGGKAEAESGDGQTIFRVILPRIARPASRV